MRSIFALMNAETFGFSRRARGGRTVKPEMPTMRQSSSSRYSVSVVSSVRQTMRLGIAVGAVACMCASCPGIARVSGSPRMIPTLLGNLERWLFEPPESIYGRPLWKLTRILRYPYALIRDILRGDLTLRAMSLVYTTLLSIVPLIALSFSVLKGLGDHRELEPVLYTFLEPLGDRGYELTEQIMASSTTCAATCSARSAWSSCSTRRCR